MLIGIKDLTKLLAITVVTCCAVFVCALFLNYNLDIAGIKDQITSPQGMVIYDIHVATGKVVVGVSGGCLVATTIILLIFYVKNYVDSHGRELGILKAMGHSNFNVARRFWVFGLSVFAGSVLGYAGAWAYMPTFYEMQNKEGLLPELLPRLNIGLVLGLLVLPAVFFMLLAVLYALFRLRAPVMDLLRQSGKERTKKGGGEERELPFLTGLRKSNLRSGKILVFFVGFSAFCFSAMTQMSMSMNELSSETFSWMIISIGLILAFTTLLMSLSTVIKANSKTIAMMKVFGYSWKECGAALLGGYRPASYIGFAIGTVYQYILLRIVVDVIFADYENMPEYGFSFKGLFISLAAFVAAYELIIYIYSRKIERQSVKSIMLE